MREESTSPDARELRRREQLRARARELARVPPPAASAEAVDVVTFALGDERFALPSRYVVGAFRVTTLALLPPAAAPLLGITEWQGDLLMLLDLRRALGYSTQALSDRTLALALGEREPVLGILVDRVLDHRAMSLADVLPAPAGAASSAGLLHGITGDAVLLIDPAALLAAHPSQPMQRMSRS
jgi:purine-binding chemotaxis protein CheW